MSLVLDNLTKHFGTVTALDGISFSVKPGEVFGFLGGNGAGKTTTMRIVLDILRADSGSVTWNGQPTAEAPRATWGYLPEERGLYPRMGVLDQLVFLGDLYKLSRKEAARRAKDWLERFQIADYAKRRAEELSKGNQQKIQFIAAVLHEPPVLLMDEPFVGLDPVNVALLKEAFLEMKGRGATIVFSTHQMEMVEELCESVVLIDRGKVVLGGPVREVRRSTGRQVIRLAIDGDTELAWLADVPGVRVVRPGQDYAELDVEQSVDPETVLRAALDRGKRVTQFLIDDPSIEEIFIEKVGRKPTEELHLVGTGAASGGPGAPAGSGAGAGAGTGASTGTGAPA
ncbi:MAG: ATP-binding cassette domain-containing protein [Chloroflexi bacterium]|nr:ATP-binding cassette domain-containing protein [Chloroflexota bacterium]